MRLFKNMDIREEKVLRKHIIITVVLIILTVLSFVVPIIINKPLIILVLLIPVVIAFYFEMIWMDVDTNYLIEIGVIKTNTMTEINTTNLISITLWYYVDDTFNINWYINQDSANKSLTEMLEKIEIVDHALPVQTYEGSDIHLQAIKNEENLEHLKTKL